MVNEIPKQSLPIAIPPLAELLQLTAKSSDYIWVEFFQARATFTRYTLELSTPKKRLALLVASTWFTPPPDVTGCYVHISR